jgi:hypothetical protein
MDLHSIITFILFGLAFLTLGIGLLVSWGIAFIFLGIALLIGSGVAIFWKYNDG